MDFADFVYLSQVQQGLAIKTAVDYWRSLKPHCMGTLYWQLNDTWPVASWACLDHGGGWKLLHHMARRFFAARPRQRRPRRRGDRAPRRQRHRRAPAEITLTAVAARMDGTTRALARATAHRPHRRRRDRPDPARRRARPTTRCSPSRWDHAGPAARATSSPRAPEGLDLLPPGLDPHRRTRGRRAGKSPLTARRPRPLRDPRGRPPRPLLRQRRHPVPRPRRHDHLHPRRRPARPAAFTLRDLHQRLPGAPRGPTFSYQLYSSRNFPPLADTLKMLAALGYDAVEGYGALYADDAPSGRAAESLAASGLTMPTAHFGLDHARSRPRQGARHRARPRHRDASTAPTSCPTSAPTTRRAGTPSASGCRRPASPTATRASASAGTTTISSSSPCPTARCPQDARSSTAARIWNGRPTSPGSSAAAPTRSPGSRNTARASPRPMSRTSPPRARTRTRTAGPISAKAPSTGRSVMAGARSPRPCTNFIMEHDNPIGPRPLRARSRSPAATGPHDMTPRHRHHRLRQHLDRLSLARAALQRPRGPRRAPT